MDGQVPDCIEIKDDDGFSPKHFNFSSQYKDDIKKILVPHGLIRDRIDALAKQIFDEYTKDGNNNLHCICVLKGGFKFFADLSERLNTESTGNVVVSDFHNSSQVNGNNVLLVEDLIDTGKSMVALTAFIKNYSPKSIKCCSLLIKRTSKSIGYLPDYLGFSVPDQFIIGYAIDYNDYFRDLEHVCAISESAVEKYKK